MNSIFLNSFTGSTNLQPLQNKSSLFFRSLILVGIFPQYNESPSQLGQVATSNFIPNSFLTSMLKICKSSILVKGRICPNGNFYSFLCKYIFQEILNDTDIALEIYIKHEGGNEIINRALSHYRKRISTISSSPELADAGAMFGMILQQEASKVRPKVELAKDTIRDYLSGKTEITDIKQDLSLYEKSLYSYKTDILKARDTGQEYYLKLINNIREAEKDLPLIEIALKKIQNANN